MQVKIIVLFVVLVDGNKMMYDSKIIFGHRVPRNEQKDIAEICAAVNMNAEDNLKYVDIFGVLDQDGNTIWRDDEDKTVLNDKFTVENQAPSPECPLPGATKG
jgi:hypothetical protein